MNNDVKKNFSHTLNLPKTEFPLQPQTQQSEQKLLVRWQENRLYRQSLEQKKDKTPFVLHNGPPYSNGNIHVGHILNQTLKDFVCRSQRMEDKQVFFQAGWDCHGLPIELRVIKDNGWDQLPQELNPLELKAKCKAFAENWINKQRADLERLGLMADFENYYSTMSPQYEAGILEVFAKFVAKDFIFRREKTVPWCYSCQTTLATAEIEYKDRKDPSCFVLFALEHATAAEFLSKHAAANGKQLYFLAWTTTPWTLPLNRALVLRPETEYALVEFAENKAFVVASKLAAKVCQTVGLEAKVLATFNSDALSGCYAQHPLDIGRKVPVIFDQMVGLEDGTAVVHCAPGCGPEDYLLGQREGLEIYSPLNANGAYNNAIFAPELVGMHINDGQWWVLRFLHNNGSLLFKGNITHAYPHCWRCKNPLMFRATKQWFCHLETSGIKSKLLASLEQIKFIPEWGRNRLEASVKTRTEWCLSRQRHWGVPIVALKCKHCDAAFTSEALVLAVAAKVALQGIVYWDNVSINELQELCPLPVKGCVCARSEWVKEKDIIDVWFESGASFWPVLMLDKRASVDGQSVQGLPADLYLEGSDQHRAWFQTSLLCAIAATEKPCMKAILTHGYIVDEKREKMSKSLGNTLDAQELLAGYGADVLRLWVCSTDYQNDAPISRKMLDGVAGIFRKIRNTFRFLLSNLYDYDGTTTEPQAKLQQCLYFRLPHDYGFLPQCVIGPTNIVLHAMDYWILNKLLHLSKTIRKAYREYDFTTIFSLFSNFCNNDLSAQYLDIIKDRLYTEPASSNSRRAAQATCYHLLDFMCHLIAPVLPFLAEEVSDLGNPQKVGSIHNHTFTSEDYLRKLLQELETKFLSQSIDVLQVEFTADNLRLFWQLIDNLRTAILRSIERQREQKIIKHSLEAHIELFVNVDNADGRVVMEGLNVIDRNFEGARRFLADFLIVSQISFKSDTTELEATDCDWLHVKVSLAQGAKCLRCWKWEISVSEDLCQRCSQTVRLEEKAL